MSILSIMIPILLLGSVFLVIYIYRIIYRQNMNKALHGDATTGLIDIGSLLKTLSIIALLIMNIVALTKISDLSYELDRVETNITNQLVNLRSTVNFLESDMRNYYQSQELIQDKEKALVGVDLANEIYTYDIEFTLLEKETDADVYLVVELDGVSNNILLSSTSLTYSTSIDLEYDESRYSISVLIEGTKLVQDDLFDIDVENDSFYILSPGVGVVEGHNVFSLVLYVRENLYLVENLTVAAVEIEIIGDEVLLETHNITSITDMNTLLAPFDEDNVDFMEIPEGNSFAVVFDLDHEVDEYSFNFTVTLSDGTVIERTTGW